ncbi:uncharacterized protein DSM5745_05792 [Aspergillus mulundensis]|uniref:Uncharacterized protein n=1 Tax=Aspergillus mulundensis TaxID=1810919 RepID=A0A3D8RYK6_9EURO|nr:hypothetical protein DSM5745_05792 [Aspergillus mulundensis]RDW78940.1 hypothetical protein DSM5745_05792 [Aspergillus mulundensis]
MESTAAPDVYFTLDGRGAVTAITINDREVIERKVLLDSELLPSWVIALHEMRASIVPNAMESCDVSPPPPGDHPSGFDGVCSTSADVERAANALDVQGLLQPHLESSASLGAEARTVDSGVDFPFDILPDSSETWDDLALFNLPAVPTSVPEVPDTSIPGASEPQNSHTDPSRNTQAMAGGLKRAQKLHRMLQALENHAVLGRDDHNREVESLYNGPQLPACESDGTMVHFASVLGSHSSISAAVGTIYGLLSWNIYGLEEDRLIREEGLSPYIAAKQMNQKMTSALRCRGKSNDWASDGRRAAKAVFGALKGTSISMQSFALILLAEVFSLDYLLKIAHFPALRVTFQEQFARIAQSRSAEWRVYLEHDYKVFDYHLFLSLKSHCIPVSQSAVQAT